MGRSGGVFYIERSATWQAAPDGAWNGSTTDPTVQYKNVLFGWDTAVLSGDVEIPGFPLVVWSASNSLNRTALGLGSNSSALHAFVEAELFPKLPQQIGIYMGSRSELYGEDGEIILGGYDKSRVNGSFTWFPIAQRSPDLECPLQIMVDDVILKNINGSQSLMPDSSSQIPMCQDPIQNAFTFPTALYNRWEELTQHPDTQPSDGSPPYTDQTYPWEKEVLIGELTLHISNSRGDTFESTIPHHEMVSHERGSDSQGKYSVINATRAMSAVGSPTTGILGQALFGGVFLSHNYLFIDYERGEFGLAPANLGPRDPNLRHVESRCSANDAVQSSQRTITALAVVAAFALTTAIGFAFFLWRRRNNTGSPAGDGQINQEVSAQNAPMISDLEGLHNPTPTPTVLGDRGPAEADGRRLSVAVEIMQSERSSGSKTESTAALNILDR